MPTWSWSRASRGSARPGWSRSWRPAAPTAGRRVGRARSYAAEGELAYGVAVAWLRTRALPRRAAPAAGTELARLLPELGAARPPPRIRRDRSDPAVRGHGRRPHRDRRPSLLVADDAHWSDRTASSSCTTWSAPPTRRSSWWRRPASEDLDDRHPLVAAVAGLVAVDRATELRLDRLPQAATIELARRLGLRRAQRRPRRRPARRDRGQPAVRRRDHPRRLGRRTSDGRAQPQAAGRHRGPAAAAVRPRGMVLGVAATVGRRSPPTSSATRPDVDDLALVRALDELWRRGVIREHRRRRLRLQPRQDPRRRLRPVEPGRAGAGTTGLVAAALHRPPPEDSTR